MADPQGQTESGTPCASLPNPKTQAAMGDGTAGLPSGATGSGWGPQSSTNSGSGGSDQNPNVINPYVSADGQGVPSTTNVSADRIQQIDPGTQTLGDC